MLSRKRLAAGAGLVAFVAVAVTGYAQITRAPQGHSDVSSQSRKGLQRYTPSAAEWASLTIEPVTPRAFRAERVTEGKIGRASCRERVCHNV